MHGLVNRALQGFLVKTYGHGVWDKVRQQAALPFEDFEAMLSYDPRLTEAVVSVAATCLDRPADAVLEDLGTWIVADPGQERVRRLLRFGGADFHAFLFSLDELPDRTRMALPMFDVPDFTLTQLGRRTYRLGVTWTGPELTPLVAGALRAIADDYGALVLIEVSPEADGDGARAVVIELLDNSFSAGRGFDLGGAAA